MAPPAVQGEVELRAAEAAAGAESARLRAEADARLGEAEARAEAALGRASRVGPAFEQRVHHGQVTDL